MKDQLQKLLGVWNNLSFNQRIVLGTLCIAAIMVIFFFYNNSQQDYDVMLSNLDEADAAAIVGSLKQEGVPFKLQNGGTTILVPRSRKEEARLNVFKNDLVKSDKTVGFGMLKSLPFGMTDWQEQKYDQKIISDEVVETLEKIQGIRKARVILAQPPNSVFSDQKEAPTASVMLIVDPGFRLSTDQVKTIRNLVAHSVPGLTPENVAISDSMGHELTDAVTSAEGATGGGSDEDNIRRTFENQKSKDILDMLTAVVGPNNAVVKVSATMDFDQTESKIKRYIPAGGTPENPTGIPVSVQQNLEAYNGAGSANAKDQKSSGGKPGTASNTPTYPVDNSKTGQSGADSKYNNQQTTTNYDISTEEKTIVHAPGSVKRMSIAVIVNKVLTPTQTQDLSKLIASASGADPSRGDSITVSGLQFSSALQDQQKQSLDILKQTNQQQLILSLVQLGGIFLFAIAALFIFYKLIQRPVDGEVVEESYTSPLIEETEALLSSSSIPALEVKLDPEIEMMRESLNAMVTKDPSEAARVLVTYMKDI